MYDLRCGTVGPTRNNTIVACKLALFSSVQELAKKIHVIISLLWRNAFDRVYNGIIIWTSVPY